MAGEMVWEKDGSSLEIRTQAQLPDGRPALDDIVAGGAFVHLEQMAHDHWWMKAPPATISSRALSFTWSRWRTITGGWVWKLVESTSICHSEFKVGACGFVCWVWVWCGGGGLGSE